MAKHHGSADSQILARIRRRGRGWVFTPADFADLGTRNAVASALKRHKAAGLIRSLARGLYDYPRKHAVLGVIAPSLDTAARAIARRYRIRIQPHGFHAANLLGLSDQVAMRTILLTDGASRVVKIGRSEIRFKHASPRAMATAGRISGLVFQALRNLGSGEIDDQTARRLDVLIGRLKDADRARLRKDLHLAPIWISNLLRPLLATAA